jgi:hypothetical protein
MNFVFDSVLDEAQNGSGKGRIYMVCIFVFSQLTQRHKECNLTMLLVFPAFEKAVDEAVRNKAWQIMTYKDFP